MFVILVHDQEPILFCFTQLYSNKNSKLVKMAFKMLEKDKKKKGCKKNLAVNFGNRQNSLFIDSLSIVFQSIT